MNTDLERQEKVVTKSILQRNQTAPKTLRYFIKHNPNIGSILLINRTARLYKLNNKTLSPSQIRKLYREYVSVYDIARNDRQKVVSDTIARYT